jgi:hypothetical protein
MTGMVLIEGSYGCLLCASHRLSRSEAFSPLFHSFLKDTCARQQGRVWLWDFDRCRASLRQGGNACGSALLQQLGEALANRERRLGPLCEHGMHGLAVDRAEDQTGLGDVGPELGISGGGHERGA